MNTERAKFNYVFINLSNVKVPFLKNMSFLAKGFYLNLASNVKCILNCRTASGVIAKWEQASDICASI